MDNNGATYKEAGVDIHAGYELVKRIKNAARSTYRPEVLGDLGSFGALFALGKYREPVLVSGTDGVGTKLKIAFMADKHDTVGLDLVAYCVNDIICQGAEPLFFLDYLAVGKLDPKRAAQIVEGIAQGCRQAGCALIGGETAEMPGFYPEDEYDLAGFTVGVVERDEIIDGSRVQPGDKIIGIGSTGLQSSGYSLVRHVFFKLAGWDIDHVDPRLGRPLYQELLEPTGIYAREIMELKRKFNLHGVANISGGGLPENLPRAMAEGTRARIKLGSWPVLPIFDVVAELGKISEEEMYNTFNMGIAMAVIVPAEEAEAVCSTLTALGQRAYVIGECVAGERGVDFV
ncbi:MAG: phosphoribosylformylglycinamidine cyclo-ligase [Firmicutes bacterium]|nr:phosphoribosylformylglycinamidine cyclo-ligase [Bacillota bacterium]HQD40586.1 phosphoribosylformylglycinamidine cyclo-ligase [Bacillota bacterium]